MNRATRVIVTLFVVTGVLAACSSLLQSEPDESLLYSVEVPAGFRESCLGGKIDPKDLPFSIWSESLDISESQGGTSEHVNYLSYRCDWDTEDDESSTSFRGHASLRVSVNAIDAFANFDPHDPNLAGDLMIDSLSGWETGYCSVLSTVDDREKVEVGYLCEANSSNLTVKVEVYTSDELDMEALMELLTPTLQESFAKE